MSTIKEYLDKTAKGENVPHSINHALSEFVYAKWMTADGVFDDEMQESMCQNLVDVIELVASQGHSGFSIQYLVNCLTLLLKNEPITPLTGAPDEWVKFDDTLYMNKRCLRVAKYGENKPAYDIDGVVYYEKTIDSDGKESRTGFFTKTPTTPITFPYTPITEYLPAN